MRHSSAAIRCEIRHSIRERETDKERERRVEIGGEGVENFYFFGFSSLFCVV